jgi:hypothetical protein
MAMAESDQLVGALKEIRDELRALRSEIAGRGGRMTTSGVRTEVVDRRVRWQRAALAVGGVAGLALVISLAMRERPAAVPVAVAPQVSATAAALPTPAVIPAQTAVVPPTPVAAHLPVPASKAAKPPAVAPTPATRQAARLPARALAPAATSGTTGTTTIASVPAPSKKRVKPDVAAKPPAEVASDEDETLAFPPPPKRVRVHRLSYGPVESEPAKL